MTETITPQLKFDAISVDFLKTVEQTNLSIYLTGKAGAGKSTIINFWTTKTKKTFILLGTTGAAATNIGGQTLDSFFGIIPGEKGNRMTAETRAFIRKKLDTIVIDEGSMLRADKFDNINYILQKIMGNDEFMGGKQLILIGDLHQLPPVPEKDTDNKEFYDKKYKGLFFFFAQSYDDTKFKKIELQKVYRQKDPKFISILNRLRIGDNSWDIVNYFNQRSIEEEDIHPQAIYIATTNQKVNTKNELELAKIEGKEEKSIAMISGTYPPDEYPCDRFLKLKIGCRVMFTVNEKNQLYVNGTLGTVLDIYTNHQGFADTVIVESDDGIVVELKKQVWEKKKGVDENGDAITVGRFIQIPLKLAFAITAHKSQGKTFDHIVVDTGWGCFLAGQLYVILSRAKSFEGIQLLQPIKRKEIMVSNDVLLYMKK